MSRRWLLRLAALPVILILIVAALLAYVYWRVDREWVADRLSTALSRKVTIGALKVDLLSAVGGVTVGDMLVSRRLPPQRIAALKTVPDNLLFIRAREGRLRLRWLPLLRRRLEVESLILQAPEVRLVRYADGSTSLDDLLQSEPGSDPALAGLKLGALHIAGGSLLWEDRGGGARYRLDNLIVNGEKKPDASALGLVAAFRLRSLRGGKAAMARSVDMDCRLRGPLDLGMLPGGSAGFSFRVDLPRGVVTGVRLLQRIRSLPPVNDLLGGLQVLGDDITWTDGALRLELQRGVVRVRQGEIRTRGYSLSYGGTWDPAADQLNLELVFRFPRELTPRLKAELTRRIQPLVPRFLKGLTSAQELAEGVVELLRERDGRLSLACRVGGTPAAPRVRLLRPDIISLRRIVLDRLRESAGRKGSSLLRSLLSPPDSPGR